MIEFFESAGIGTPKVRVVTVSLPLRIDLIDSGEYVTALRRSLADRYALKSLPIDLPLRAWSVAITMLKNRTLSPVIERFIEHERDFTRPMRMAQSNRRK
jgi:DNA-binding transcriptional LysR family regulator